MCGFWHRTCRKLLKRSGAGDIIEEKDGSSACLEAREAGGCEKRENICQKSFCVLRLWTTPPQCSPSTRRMSFRPRFRANTMRRRWRSSRAASAPLPKSCRGSCASSTARLPATAMPAPHRTRAAYQWSVETSIYVAQDWHRHGIAGRDLRRAVRGARDAGLL